MTYAEMSPELQRMIDTLVDKVVKKMDAYLMEVEYEEYGDCVTTPS